MSNQVNKKIVSFIQGKKESTKSILSSNYSTNTTSTINVNSKSILLKKSFNKENDENKNLININLRAKERSRLNSSHKEIIEKIPKPNSTSITLPQNATFQTSSSSLCSNSHSELCFTNFEINKQLANDFTHEDYRKMETLYIREHHCSDFQQSLLKIELPIYHGLEKHKINERMRMRMVDWMIEVVNNYKCDESVFFLAVDLMDKYFYLVNKSLDPSDLHLIGVTTMFSSSKLLDIYPLRLKMIYEKIAHKKLSCEDIKNKELEILSLIDYDLNRPTSWDFILFFIEEIFALYDNRFNISNERLREYVINYNLVKNKGSELINNSISSSGSKTIYKSFTLNMINLLKHVCLYLAKMNMHDYSLIIDKHPSLLAASTVFVGLKICEQINKVEYLTDCFIKKLVQLSNRKESDIIKAAQKILHNAQNFDTVFNGLDNLKRIHFNAIIDLKNTK